MTTRALALGIVLSASAAFGIAALPAFAQNTDVIKERKELMEGNGRAAKAGAAFLKGETPFDAAKAAEIFTTINADTKKFATLFPEDSKTGEKTEAAPAIWEKPEAFKAANDKMIADSQAAIDAKPASLDEFKVAFGKVAQNCKGCHEEFRVDK